MGSKYSGNKRIARNTAFLYIRMIFVLFVSLYTTRVVLNALGVVDYGIYSVVGGFVAMFTFFNATMIQSVQRYFNYERGVNGDESENLVYNTAVYIQIAIALVLLLILETLGLWYVNNIMVVPEDRLGAANLVYQFSVVSLILVVLQIPYSSAILAHEKMDFYALVSILDAVLKLLIVIILPYIPADRLIVYGILILFVGLVNFVLYFGFAKSKFKFLVFSGIFDKELFRSMLGFSGWNILDMLAYTLKSQGGTVLINAYFGPMINAARGISMLIMSAVQGFSANIMTAFRPQLVESYAKEDYNRVSSLFFNMSRISYMFFFVLSVPIVLELDYILDLWLAGNVPDYTIPFTILCLADMLICSLNTPLSYVAQAVGVIKRYNYIRSIVIAAIIPISWFFLHCGGEVMIVYWVSLAMVIINQPISMWLLHDIYDYSYYDYAKKVLLPICVLSVIIAVASYIPHMLLPHGFIRVLIVGMTDAIVSCLSVYYIMLNSSERIKIIQIVRNKLHI